MMNKDGDPVLTATFDELKRLTHLEANLKPLAELPWFTQGSEPNSWGTVASERDEFSITAMWLERWAEMQLRKASLLGWVDL